MDNENSTQPKETNEAENQTPKNDGTQTTEDATTTGGGSGNGEKQEESPYAKQLKEMEEREAALKVELEKKDEVIEKKEDTIQSLKKAKKDAPALDEASIEERILSKIRAEKQADEVQVKVAKITSDPTEQAVILRHYNTSIQKSGNVEQDLLNAVAIANSHVVIEQKRNKAQEEQREDFLTSFSTPSIRGSGGSVTIDPVQRAAEEMVRNINPDAVKHVKAQFQNN